MLPFNDTRFKAQVEEALKQIRTVLDHTKHPKFAADVFHDYEDKYRLAEMLGNVAAAAQGIRYLTSFFDLQLTAFNTSGSPLIH